MHIPRARLSRLSPEQRHNASGVLVQLCPQPRPRPFTSNTKLSDVSRPQLRPQLPFLAREFRRHPFSRRLISTEVKDNLKYQIKLGIYWTFLGWAIMGGIGISAFVLKHDWLDKQYPSPSEWHWLIRFIWRDVRREVETGGRGRGEIPWAEVGYQYRAIIAMLEDMHFIWHYPSGLVQQEDFDKSIPGISEVEMRSAPPVLGSKGTPCKSRIGFDITMKSDEWRRGYFEAMMGQAKAAEKREGYVADRKSKVAYPPEYVRSPDNPYPKPLPTIGDKKKAEVPDIRDCDPVFESADFHYKRILTTTGFTRTQRVEAGIAYANYLEQAHSLDLAYNTYYWSLYLAMGGVPNADRIIDTKTGVLRSDASFVTPNILITATALAGFCARNESKGVSVALPIYLSVLRARQQAPPAPTSMQYRRKLPDYSFTSVDNVIRWLRALPFKADPAPLPLNGDAPYERSKSTECEEAALMAYVGEILFARSDRRGEGLDFTKRANGIAENMNEDTHLDSGGRKTCKECVRTTLENWHAMVEILATEQRSGPVPSQWLGLWGGGDKLVQSQDWQDEAKAVDQRLFKLNEKHMNDRLNAAISGQSNFFVV